MKIALRCHRHTASHVCARKNPCIPGNRANMYIEEHRFVDCGNITVAENAPECTCVHKVACSMQVMGQPLMPGRRRTHAHVCAEDMRMCVTWLHARLHPEVCARGFHTTACVGNIWNCTHLRPGQKSWPSGAKSGQSALAVPK